MGLYSVEARSVVVSEAFMLNRRLAAVTGAASGIGRAIATEFVRAGAHVHCLDRDGEAVKLVALELGSSATAHQCDVSDPTAVQSTFDAIEGVHGLHILVHPAGVSHIGNIENLSLIHISEPTR